MEKQTVILEHSLIKRAYKYVNLADQMQERLMKHDENSNCYSTLFDNGDHSRKIKITAWVSDYEAQRSIEFNLHIETEFAISLMETLENYIVDDYKEYLKATKK